MEPVDYLKIIQRHWKVAAGLVVIALLAVFLTSPNQPHKSYVAKNTLLRDQASGNGDGSSAADNPNVVALWATAGEVPQRAAQKLGFTGPVDDLINTVSVTPSAELGTVELDATADSPERSVQVVNAFAGELLNFIKERDAARVQQAEQDAAKQDAELRKQIQALQPTINAGGPDAKAAQAQSDNLSSQIGFLANDTAAARASTEWVSLQPASSAKPDNSSAVGATRNQRLLLAGLVSVLLAFGVAIMLDRSDSRLHTKEQAERQFGLPVLAEVPLLPMRSRHRAAVFGFQHDVRLAEAYRSLRTALLLFRDRLPLELEAAELSGHPHRASSSAARQVILVTSPDAGDGKSTTAANLAMAYAEAGQSVLLVCWDLWRPMSTRVFGIEDGPGVSEFLATGNTSLVRFVQSTSVAGLHVVPSGATGQQPGGQLDAELRLLEEARSLADVVIIDTAPILAASVTRELVTMADVVVLACRVGRTTSPSAERCAELLERLGAPTLGVVLVGMPTGLFRSDYYSTAQRRDRQLAAVAERSSGNGGYRAQPRAADEEHDETRFQPGGQSTQPQDRRVTEG